MFRGDLMSESCRGCGSEIEDGDSYYDVCGKPYCISCVRLEYYEAITAEEYYADDIRDRERSFELLDGEQM